MWHDGLTDEILREFERLSSVPDFAELANFRTHETKDRREYKTAWSRRQTASKRNAKAATRGRALEMLREGLGVREVARRIGVSSATVSRWGMKAA